MTNFKIKISPRKSLGQNFLKSSSIQRRMVESADLCASDVVLEIGPGTGALTALICPQVRHLTLVEKDRRLIAPLQEMFQGHGHVQVVHEDILNFDVCLFAESKGTQKLKVIGSLPYYVTTPILFHLVAHRAVIDSAVILVQKEVAERIVAAPGGKAYGALTLGVRSFCDAAMIRHVPPGSFWPAPDVTSSILKLSFLGHCRYALLDEDGFFVFTKAMFSKRRKQIVSALHHIYKESLSKNDIRGVLQDLRIPETERMENLDLEMLTKVYNRFVRKE